MADHHTHDETKPVNNDFANQANQQSRGIFGEYLDFLRDSKKWWLTPIIIFLLLIGVLIVLGSTGAAPFIYTLF